MIPFERLRSAPNLPRLIAHYLLDAVECLACLVGMETKSDGDLRGRNN